MYQRDSKHKHQKRSIENQSNNHKVFVMLIQHRRPIRCQDYIVNFLWWFKYLNISKQESICCITSSIGWLLWPPVFRIHVICPVVTAHQHYDVTVQWRSLEMVNCFDWKFHAPLRRVEWVVITKTCTHNTASTQITHRVTDSTLIHRGHKCVCHLCVVAMSSEQRCQIGPKLNQIVVKSDIFWILNTSCQ